MTSQQVFMLFAIVQSVIDVLEMRNRMLARYEVLVAKCVIIGI